MGNYRTVVAWDGEAEMPRVFQVSLEQQGVFAPHSSPHHVDVRLPNDPVNPYPTRLLQRNDDVRYFRRWAEDVRSEFRRACARRRFFQFWQPDMEAVATAEVGA